MHTVTSILLVTKSRNPPAEDTAAAIEHWLTARGLSCITLSADCPQEELFTAAQGVQLCVILGGDGTFVGISRRLVGLKLPLLGINFGQVGFLADLTRFNWKDGFKKLLAGAFRICPRSVLVWSLIRMGQTIRDGYAANDIVVSRGAVARIIPVRVSVDNGDLGQVRADGVIVSTPLGTSAYALSAHGALVHPDVPALALTPVSPFYRSFPPMILPANSCIKLKTESHDAFLTIDGQEGIALAKEDSVHVQTLDAGLRLVSTNGSSYYQRLRERGFIGTLGESNHKHS